jgi:hypothetical protein
MYFNFLSIIKILQIYILEHDHDDNSSILARKQDGLYRESPMISRNWIKPIEEPSLSYPIFNYNSISTSTFSVKLSPR